MMRNGQWPVSEMRLTAVALWLAAVYVLVSSSVVRWATPVLAERVRALLGECNGASGVLVGTAAAVLSVCIWAWRRS